MYLLTSLGSTPPNCLLLCSTEHSIITQGGPQERLGAVHILRKHILGSLNTLGGVVSTW